MQIVITYEDGTCEAVSARLEGQVVSVGHRMAPGILPDEPKRCYFMSDYFLCAINEGHEREGLMRPEPGDIDPDTGKPEWMGFTWKLVGNEADACRAKMRKWIGTLHSGFDPEMEGAESPRWPAPRPREDRDRRVRPGSGLLANLPGRSPL